MPLLPHSQIEIGDIFQLNYGPDNAHNRTIHVRAIVDDYWVVVRSWSKRRRRWNYTLQDLSFFEETAASGHLEKIEKD